MLSEQTKLERNTKRQNIWWWRLGRLVYLRFLRLRGKPKTIARGLAVGVFAGCFPFFGLQTVIGIILASCLRGSKMAAAVGTWISNPLTYIPIFVFNFKVGKFLLGIKEQPLTPLNLESFTSFMELGVTFTITLLVGCLVVGIVLAIITYFASIRLVKRWRKHRHHNLHL